MGVSSVALRLIIGGDASGAKRALGEVSGASGKLGKGLKVATAGAAVGLTAITGLGAAGVSAYENLVSAVASLQRQSKLSASDASLLVGQWQRYGVSIEAGGRATMMLSKQIDAANQGVKPSIESFKRLGISMEDLKTKSPAQILEEVRQKLADMPPSAARTSLASKLLGRGFQSMSKWISASGADIAETNKQTAESGQVLSDAQLAQGKKDLAEQAKMKREWTGILVAVGQSAAPMLASFVGMLTKMLRILHPIAPVLKYVAAGLAAFLVVGKIYTIIGPLVTALKGFGLASKAVALGTQLMAAAQWLWNAALTANPIGIIIVAIVALAAIFVVLWLKCAWFRNFWKAVWSDVWGALKWVWERIGPFVIGAVVTLWNGLKVWFGIIKTLLSKAWDGLLAVTRKVWPAVVFLVRGFITDIKIAIAVIKVVVAIVRTVWQAIATITRTVWGVVKLVVVNAIKSIVTAVRLIDGVRHAIQGAWNAVYKITMAVWDRVKGYVAGIINWAVDKITWLWDQIKAVGKAIKGFLGGSDEAKQAYAGGGRRAAPTLPVRKMAVGGDYMVNRPTLFLAGEAGPERATFTPQGRSAPGGLTVNVNIANVHGTDGATANAFANKVASIVAQRQRMVAVTGY